MYPAPYDYRAMLEECRRLGWSPTSIEDETGISNTTLSNWQNNDQQPHHHAGEWFIAFYLAVTGKVRAQIPCKPWARPGRKRA